MILTDRNHQITIDCLCLVSSTVFLLDYLLSLLLIVQTDMQLNLQIYWFITVKEELIKVVKKTIILYRIHGHYTFNTYKP